jgi:hypothetical protein
MLAVQRAGEIESLLPLTLSCTGICWLYREQERLNLYFLSLSAVQEHAGCTESRRAWISTFSHSQLYRNMLAVQRAGELGALLTLTLSCTSTCRLYREQESWNLYFFSLSAVQEHAGCTESRRA